MTNDRKGLSPRETALKIMYRVDREGAYANLELNKTLAGGTMDKQDRSLVTELVYGTIRMRGALDYILGKFVKTPLEKMPIWIVLILRMAIYQMIYMDKIPDRAAVNEAVNLAKKYGHAGTVKLVNGVLRNVSRQKETISFPSIEEDPVGHISTLHSHPAWLVKRWIKQMGIEETLKLCEANNRAPGVTVRVNTLKISRDELLERLRAEGIEARPGKYAPESIEIIGGSQITAHPGFEQGLFQVQDESSMVVAHVVGAKVPANIIDVCAAPGGKTTHIAQTVQNQGRIKAFDVHSHKLPLIEESAKRLGINIVETAVQDATALPRELDEWADYVLVDAPCSGLGVLRRRPDARWAKEEKIIKELTVTQRKILDEAANTVKPGGVLVYSTCTIAPEENEQMVKKFLADHPEFSPETLVPFLPFALDPEETAQATEGMLQLLPHIHDTDGFFISRMRKQANGKSS